MGHNYMGHNYMGHSYMGHGYMGHNYLQVAVAEAGKVIFEPDRPEAAYLDNIGQIRRHLAAGESYEARPTPQHPAARRRRRSRSMRRVFFNTSEHADGER